jgi:hypothetical protein
LKNINSGHIEALNSILESRSGYSFGFPPDPCFESPAGFPPDPCLVANVAPAGGLLHRVSITPVAGGTAALQVTLPDSQWPPGPCRITVFDASNFEIIDGEGNPLMFAPVNIVHQPPG